MQRFIVYSFFFALVILLQFFLLDSLNFSIYIHPLLYIAFIILLPMKTPSVVLLLLGFTTGVTIDFITGEGGLNTIATLFTAFIRPLILNFTLGHDAVEDGGVPSSRRIGRGKFLRYSSLMIFVQCFIYFTFESLTWEYYYLTLLRIVLSGAVTVLLVYLFQMLLITSRSTQSKV